MIRLVYRDGKQEDFPDAHGAIDNGFMLAIVKPGPAPDVNEVIKIVPANLIQSIEEKP